MHVLLAIADRALGAATVRSVSVLERQFLGYVTCRRHLAFDTRYSARAAGRAELCAHLYMVMEGTFTPAGGRPLVGPVAFMLADVELERVDPRTSITFRTEGPRVALAQLKFPLSHVRVPVGLAHGPLALGTRAFEAAHRLIADTDTGTIGPASFAALLDALAAAGVIVANVAQTIVSPEPERFERLWSAIRPLYAEFAASVSLKEIAGLLGMSQRQLSRVANEAARTFHVPARGFRDLAYLLRLRAAAMLLGAPDATVNDIATLVGYGSAIAMGRAFRDAKLPTPSDVRKAMRSA